MVYKVLVLVLATCAYGCAEDPWAPQGGARFHTSHAVTFPLTQEDVSFPDPEIKEWHFHVYFFQNNEQSVADAKRVQNDLIDYVKRKEAVFVLNGVTSDILPGLNDSTVPEFNMEPIGPHPCGSFEVWVPFEYVGKALSYFMLYRNELTILIHPLTSHSVEDHSGRAIFLGPVFPIDLTVLEGPDDLQYPELGLGYSAQTLREPATV